MQRNFYLCTTAIQKDQIMDKIYPIGIQNFESLRKERTFHVKAEYHTSQGQIDLILQTECFIYIMEFKPKGTIEEALKQINKRHYAQAFSADERVFIKIGVNFSNETRNIEKWIVE